MQKYGAFRFTYFSNKYEETCCFYKEKLHFELEHSWNRSEDDMGSLFRVGDGLIEVMTKPDDITHQYAGLDYRNAQGAFMCIQVWNIDELFENLKSNDVAFEQEITDQSWGHRSFSVIEPNGLILFFFQE